MPTFAISSTASASPLALINTKKVDLWRDRDGYALGDNGRVVRDMFRVTHEKLQGVTSMRQFQVLFRLPGAKVQVSLDRRNVFV